MTARRVSHGRTSARPLPVIDLPVKWLIGLDDKLRVLAALAQALDLLELPRYAAVCRSATTREVLSAYETGLAGGVRAAFRQGGGCLRRHAA